MSPPISENRFLEIYVECDDLLKAFQSWSAQRALKGFLPLRRPPPRLSASATCTILIGYHLSGYKGFEYHYREAVLKTYLSLFPDAPSYGRFVCAILRVVPLLLLLLLYKCSQSVRTGYYFIDSKKPEICQLKREKGHKVFQGFARKGKGSTG